MLIIVERVTSAEDLDGLLAVEAGVISEPVDARMYLAELQNPAVSHLLVAKEPSGHGGRVLRILVRARRAAHQ